MPGDVVIPSLSLTFFGFRDLAMYVWAIVTGSINQLYLNFHVISLGVGTVLLQAGAPHTPATTACIRKAWEEGCSLPAVFQRAFGCHSGRAVHKGNVFREPAGTLDRQEPY